MSAAPQIDWSKYAESPAAAPPQIDFSKYEGAPDAGSAKNVSAPDDTGIWGSLKRNTVGAVTGLYRAFTDPATEQEKSVLLDEVKRRNANGEKVPEDLATNPSQSTLVVHRLLTNPSSLLGAKSDAEFHKAQELLHSGEHWKGANLGVSAAVDKVLSYIPGAGPVINQSAERAEKGDMSGAATDALTMGAMSEAPSLLKEGKTIASELSPIDVRAGWRKIGNPLGLASTGEELLTQGISPRTSMTKFQPSLQRAAADLKAYDAQSRIQNVHDLNDAIPEIKQKIWNEEVEPALQRQATKPVNMQPVADAVRAQISDEMKAFDEGNANKLETLASKLESARDVTGANKLLKYINGNLESYFQKFPAARKANLMTNPETAGWEAARAELRNQFLGTLEGAGETGIRDARLRYGAFDTLQDAVERRVNVADRAKPMSLGRIVGLAGAAPTAGLSVVAGELSNYLNKPDTLIRRGINALPETKIHTTPFDLPNVSPITGAALASPAQLFKKASNE